MWIYASHVFLSPRREDEKASRSIYLRESCRTSPLYTYIQYTHTRRQIAAGFIVRSFVRIRLTHRDRYNILSRIKFHPLTNL